MALNASGAISLGGATAGQSINLELGLSATALIGLNDAAVRTLLGKASGAISLNDAYGKSNRTDFFSTWSNSLNISQMFTGAIDSSGNITSFMKSGTQSNRTAILRLNSAGAVISQQYVGSIGGSSVPSECFYSSVSDSFYFTTLSSSSGYFTVMQVSTSGTLIGSGAIRPNTQAGNSARLNAVAINSSGELLVSFRFYYSSGKSQYTKPMTAKFSGNLGTGRSSYNSQAVWLKTTENANGGGNGYGTMLFEYSGFLYGFGTNSSNYPSLIKYNLDGTGVTPTNANNVMTMSGGNYYGGAAFYNSSENAVYGSGQWTDANASGIVVKFVGTTPTWARLLSNTQGGWQHMTLDSSNNVYVFAGKYNTSERAIVAKYNSSGTLQWQRYFRFTGTNIIGYSRFSGLSVYSGGGTLCLHLTIARSGSPYTYGTIITYPTDGSKTTGAITNSEGLTLTIETAAETSSTKTFTTSDYHHSSTSNYNPEYGLGGFSIDGTETSNNVTQSI